RKAERQQKKTRPVQPRVNRRFQPQDASESEDEEEEQQPLSPPAPSTNSKKAGSDEKAPKSILKKSGSTKKPEKKRSPSPSPPSPPSPVARGVKSKLDEDDAEIAALEKKLGMKGKKKLPKSFEDDGLDDLLDGIDDAVGLGDSTGKRKRSSEDEEWLEKKRRKAGQAVVLEEESEDDSEANSEDEIALDSEDEEDAMEGDSDLEVDGDEEGFSGFDDDEENSDGADDDDDMEDDEDDDDDAEYESSEEEQKPRVRENPYVAPVPANAPAPQKYIPPSLRAPAASDAEAMTRLRRQTQGLLNRLSEANLLTILKDVEQLYQNNPRQYVTTTLIELLLGLICDRTTLQDTFLILHAGFIAAVYKVIGTDFGAQLVERIVADFDKHYSNQASVESGSKETSNLVSLAAEMYNFQVIGSNLIFDYIRLFLEDLTELNTELLLRLVRLSGSQLRQDDPTSLKDIVVLMQKSVAKVGEAKLSIRTKFMIETINNLKNNRMKTGVAASAITSEHTTRMKKTLGTLNQRNIKASEPLRIGLTDIRDTEKKGKWWLVGASWRNDTAKDDDKKESKSTSKKGNEPSDMENIGSGTTDLMQLAKEQRMNTDIRRAIFITIVSASDYKDAHLRLMKLRLKKSQELEIPKVLIHCAGGEQSYNPYYTLIARRLCSEKKLKMAFQFSLWDLFKRMGEKAEGDEDDDEADGEEALTTRRLVNLGRMFGTLIAEGGLSMSVLKTLNFAYLQPKTQAFTEVLLATVILRTQKQSADQRDEKALLDAVMTTKDAPQMARGLQYFFKKVISKTDIAASKSERETVRWGSMAAADALTVL
ncbi:hypothetical protein K490DRAFT_3462, partial [Saccharata proteae CBS 121410]